MARRRKGKRVPKKETETETETQKEQNISNNSAEFFKVFLQKSYHQISIPLDFVKDFKGTLSEKVILKDVGGKEWCIYVKKTSNDVILGNGWQSYVDDHSLSEGEFLVFRYVGSFTFMVKIFGTTGCKKKKVISNVRVKIEDTGEYYNNEHAERSKEVKESEEHNSEAVVSSSPCFTSQVSSSSGKKNNKLRIPDEVLKKHGVKLQPEMVLSNQNGMEWPVNIIDLNGVMMFGKGLFNFLVHNNVQTNAHCKFTFTFDDKRSTSKMINVQILGGRGFPKKNIEDDDFWVPVTSNSSKDVVSFNYSDRKDPIKSSEDIIPFNSSNRKIPLSSSDKKFTDPDELPEFFHIYKGDMSSESMIIPRDFIEEFGENIPTICKLVNPAGINWEVDMRRVNDAWFFQNGWPVFVHENLIQDYDFLTFAYARNSTFYVKFYSPSCCLKMVEKDEEPPENLFQNEESPQENRIITRSITGTVSPSFKVQISKSSLVNSYLPIPMLFWKSHMRRSEVVTLLIDDERWDLTLTKRRDRVQISGTSELAKKYFLRVRTVCTFQLIDSTKMLFKVTLDG